VCFDAATLKILARWPLKNGEEPTGLASDLEHHRLFSVCKNKLMFVLDSDNGTIVATLPIGAKTITLDPATHALYLPTAEFGPTPASTPDNPSPKPPILPNTFVVLKLTK
jgi:hypothetical protein